MPNSNHIYLNKFTRIIICLLLFYIYSFSTFHLPQLYRNTSLFWSNTGILNGLIPYLFLSVSVLILSIWNKFELAFSWIGVSIFMLILFAIIGVYNVNNTALANGYLANKISFLLAFILVRQSLIYPDKLKHLLSIVLPIIIVVFCISYLVTNSDIIMDIINGEEGIKKIKKAKSFLGGKNQTGMILSATIPILTWVFDPSSKIRKLLVPLTIFTALISYCRNAYIAIAVFYIIKIVLDKKYTLKSLVIGGSIFSIICAIVVYILIYTKTLHIHSLTSRIRFWNVTLDMWIDNNLILGVGSGQWSLYKNLISPLEHHHPHNDFVRLLAENGPFALFLLVALLAFSVWTGLRLKKVGNNEGGNWVIASTVLYFILLFFDEFLMKLNHAYLFAFWLAIISHLYDSTTNQIRNKRVKIYSSIVGIFTLILLSYCLLLISNISQASKGWHFYKEKEYQTAITNFNSVDLRVVNAVRNVPIDYYLGKCYEKSSDVTQALQSYHKVLLAFPTNITTNAYLANYYAKKKQYNKTAEHVNRLIRAEYFNKTAMKHLRNKKVKKEVEKLTSINPSNYIHNYTEMTKNKKR